MQAHGAEQEGERFMEKTELVPGMCRQQWAQDRREGVRVQSTALPVLAGTRGRGGGRRPHWREVSRGSGRRGKGSRGCGGSLGGAATSRLEMRNRK